jgi:hypothetical protein
MILYQYPPNESVLIIDSLTSSIAIGDPVTGNDANVTQNSTNANYSLNVKDSDSLAELVGQTVELVDINSELDSLNTLLTSIETNTADTVSGLGDVVTELQSVNTELDTQTGHLSDIDTSTIDLPNVIAAEGGTQPSKGVVVMGHTGAGVVKHILVDSNGIQSVNVNASQLPTGAATSANQTTANTKLDTIITNTGNTLTDTQLRASAVPVSAASLPLPSGAATETTLGALNTKIPSQGQALMAASVPVTLASDQPALPVSFGTPAPAGVYNAKVTVGTTAIQITCNGSSPSAIRQKLVFSPVGPTAAKFYFGNSAVTSSGSNQGIELVYGQSVEFNNDPNEYYIISDTASQSVAILEVY